MDNNAVPAELPELLGVLAYELRRELGKLLPLMPADDLDALALDLTNQCRRVGGNRLPMARGVAAADLADADPAYAFLSDRWGETLGAQAGMPEAWTPVATSRLLDLVRTLLGGHYVPKGRSILTQRNEEMWHAYRGNCRATGIEFGVSSERVRQLMVPRLRAEIATRQGDLFPDELDR